MVNTKLGRDSHLGQGSEDVNLLNKALRNMNEFTV